MAFDWDTFRDSDIDPVLVELGQVMTLRRITKNADGVQAWKSDALVPETIVSEDVQGVVYDFDVKQIYESGGLVKRGDREVILSAKGIATDPDLNDRILIGTEEWNIVVMMQKIDPAGTVIAYILQVRL